MVKGAFAHKSIISRSSTSVFVSTCFLQCRVTRNQDRHLSCGVWRKDQAICRRYKYFCFGKTLNELEEEANGQIILIDKWLTANKLHLNMEKTCYTVFSPTKIKSPSISLKFNGNKLEEVTNKLVNNVHRNIN